MEGTNKVPDNVQERHTPGKDSYTPAWLIEKVIRHREAFGIRPKPLSRKGKVPVMPSIPSIDPTSPTAPKTLMLTFGDPYNLGQGQRHFVAITLYDSERTSSDGGEYSLNDNGETLLAVLRVHYHTVRQIMLNFVVPNGYLHLSEAWGAGQEAFEALTKLLPALLDRQVAAIIRYDHNVNLKENQMVKIRNRADEAQETVLRMLERLAKEAGFETTRHMDEDMLWGFGRSLKVLAFWRAGSGRQHKPETGAETQNAVADGSKPRDQEALIPAFLIEGMD